MRASGRGVPPDRSGSSYQEIVRSQIQGVDDESSLGIAQELHLGLANGERLERADQPTHRAQLLRERECSHGADELGCGLRFGAEATKNRVASFHSDLASSFLPIVSSSLGEVGATKSYKDLVGRYSALPFVSSPSLEGLFHMLGEEEKKIRKDPAARVTKLLKDVFAQSGR